MLVLVDTLVVEMVVVATEAVVEEVVLLDFSPIQSLLEMQ